MNVANSALFKGKIYDQPQIAKGKWLSKDITIVQPRVLTYELACDVVNPNNPSQTRNIGKMLGTVPITPDGVYRYDQGTLAIDILPMGSAQGFTSKFGGTAAGKPLGRPKNWLEKAKQETVNITRSSKGKTSTVTLKKYDKMEFQNVTLPQGPIAIYQQVTVNGQLFYDYDKECWFFNNFTVQYAENGVIKQDRISGTIRWIAKDSTYDFDVRVNEPTGDVAGAFSGPADEAAFFTVDTSIPGLIGTMKYKDTVVGEQTVKSNVTIELAGNNITKPQLMVLAKLIVFSAIVPMNSD